MATYKAVDVEQLDEDLTIVADAIRTKGNTTDPLDFPQGFADAVASIKAGGLPNGTKWTPCNIAEDVSDFAFNVVYNAKGLWVAGGDGYGLWYSLDGKTWTQSNVATVDVNCVCCGKGIWVAGTHGSGAYCSTDGMTWTKSTMTGLRKVSINNIAYGAGLFVAAADSNGMLYSTDGATWTKSDLANGYMYDVKYADGIWVAGSDEGWGLYYSTDGMTWLESNLPEVSTWCVYNANGIWVYADLDGYGLWWSEDGMTWAPSNITSGEMRKLANNKGVWIASSTDVGTLYSTDGKVWSQTNIPTDEIIYPVHADNGIFIAGGYDIYYSFDGANWTACNMTGLDVYSIYYAHGTWVAAGWAMDIYHSVGWEPS